MTQYQLTALKKVSSLRLDKFLYHRILTPRPATNIVLKNAWQVERGKQSSSEQSCSEGDLFKMDLRVQGVLQDQGRATKIQDLVHTFRTQSRTESVIADLSETGEFNTFSEESQKTIPKLGKIELFELVEVSEKIHCPSCAKWRPEGL